MVKKAAKAMIGWRERVSLPDLGLGEFEAKIDTGARTTALHATSIRSYSSGGTLWVEFLPDHMLLTNSDKCVLPVHHIRSITNTSGIPEERIIAVTTLCIGARQQKIEISLSDRSDMVFPMIVGRTALRLLRLTVDPSRSWLQSSQIKHHA